LQALSLKQQVLAAQLQNVDSFFLNEETTTAQAMHVFLENESEMWSTVKATKFYKNLYNHKHHETPLPLRDWIRLLLQVDTSLSVNELLRICDEEDSILAMSSVRVHLFHVHGILYLSLMPSHVQHGYCKSTVRHNSTCTPTHTVLNNIQF
jgi:hypothetical protein